MAPAPRPASMVAGVAAVAAVVALASAPLAFAQWGRITVEPNVPYDGRFTFVRLQYTNPGRGGWAYDYPAMERNFMTVVNDLTTMKPHVRGSNILTMDDPELSRYVIAYLSEPGYWVPNPAEAAGLRAWLTKGGFLIVDDFYGSQWANFERSMRAVLPDARIVPLTIAHPIFHSFFDIRTLVGLQHPQGRAGPAQYLGIHEGNDPSRRLMVVVNYNNDIGDYMEWSGEGWYPVNFTNDAYKFATNYLVYGMTR